ncbi:MAG: hypothetical protein US30_C0002G0041 [Candidatus Moranbacteria bacterium GW2011_GWF2_36_839]|nr:MAG: hypothetical protein US27_C0003G0041 [Candidatus Moranbacteria bacterium GW2011_GWF1_36_78]KKQ17581.1 MAG: hypothetical protein US30_C0002G0041 [Candidatus Moranbacteria bacterium GW2011_GWF2_36_839]HAT74307.1 hypothetical protein [Candidatus Moranbacteria bacterium]HBY10915.1 hypothetical protein [Candidatus Moranbacteria bacterium]
MIELEKTYLAKNIPANIKKSKWREVIDIYIPKSSDHPVLRIRKNGDSFEMTKKTPISDNDKSVQKEQTISLSEKEFEVLKKTEGRKIFKKRYYYDYNKNIAEIDIFKEGLSGLVLIDFEFKNKKEKDRFKMPEFCLVEVTQEEFIAGGMLCGKKYKDIEKNLNKLKYKKILF